MDTSAYVQSVITESTAKNLIIVSLKSFIIILIRNRFLVQYTPNTFYMQLTLIVDLGPVSTSDFASSLIANTTNFTLLNTVSNLSQISVEDFQTALIQLGIPTAFNEPDRCEPNGLCISGSTSALCICSPGFFGSKCEYSNLIQSD